MIFPIIEPSFSCDSIFCVLKLLPIHLFVREIWAYAIPIFFMNRRSATLKLIFNAGMVPNVKENVRNRKKSKRGAKRLFDEEIYDERFRTIELVFVWNDYKRLLIKFEHISLHHFGLKLIAYTIINLRHFSGK